MSFDTSKRLPVGAQTDVTGWLVFSAAVLQVLCGGIRFVDGRVLVKFSQSGLNATLTDFSQYLFDSPLKILFLKALGIDNAAAIGIIFLALNFLPILAVLFISRDQQERLDLLLITSVVPIWKLMFQNTGIGDAVIIAATIILIVARRATVVATAAFVMILWHFQQGLIIISILAVLALARCRPEDLVRLKAQIVGSMFAILVFVAMKALLIPPHTGRLDFIYSHMARFLPKNILYLPIALCAAVPGTILTVEALRAYGRERRGALTIAVISLIVLSVFVGSTTTDFSRVIVLLTFPILLFLSNPRAAPPAFLHAVRTPNRLVPLLAIAVVTPFFSWGGIDVFLWPRLPALFQKYLTL